MTEKYCGRLEGSFASFGEKRRVKAAFANKESKYKKTVFGTEPAPEIMYEGREEEFKKLCERVERINPEAAKYLRECPEGEGPGQCMRCGNLQVVLAWHDTPQGFEFWEDIYLLLNAETILDGEWVKE